MTAIRLVTPYLNTTSIDTTMRRLSSGLRITTAADDPAGVVRAATLRSVAGADHAAAAGINATLGLLNTADGALGSVQQMLQRLRVLAVQAGDPTLPSAARAAERAETAQLLSGIDTTLSGVAAAGTPLFGGTPGTATPYVPEVPAIPPVPAVPEVPEQPPTGARLTSAAPINALDNTDGSRSVLTLTVNGSPYTITLPKLDLADPADVLTAFTQMVPVTDPAPGPGVDAAVASPELPPVTFSLTDDGRLQITTTSTGSATTLSASGAAAAALGLPATQVSGTDDVPEVPGTPAIPGVPAIPAVPATRNKPLSITTMTGPDPGDTFSFTVALTDTTALGIAAMDIADPSAGGLVNAAISQVSALRTQMGADGNGLRHSGNALSAAQLNTTAALSSVEDTDYAQATAQLATERLRLQVRAAVTEKSFANYRNLVEHLYAQV